MFPSLSSRGHSAITYQQQSIIIYSCLPHFCISQVLVPCLSFSLFWKVSDLGLFCIVYYCWLLFSWSFLWAPLCLAPIFPLASCCHLCFVLNLIPLSRSPWFVLMSQCPIVLWQFAHKSVHFQVLFNASFCFHSMSKYPLWPLLCWLSLLSYCITFSLLYFYCCTF